MTEEEREIKLKLYEANNLLIAEFMGAKILENRKGVIFPNYGYPTIGYQLKYHFSWDFLMPVIRKIGEKSEWEMENNSGLSSEHFYIFPLDEEGGRCDTISEVEDTLFDSAYMTVVKYIKEYQKQ